MSTQLAEKHPEMIAVAAYYRAEHRGFSEGDPVADWLEAEAEIEQMLLAEPVPEMSAKHSFQQKLEAQFEEWDAELAELKAKTKEPKAKTRAEFEKQLEAITGMRAEAEEKLRELRKRSEDAWEDLKEGTAKAWDEMREALDRIVARFKGCRPSTCNSDHPSEGGLK